MQPTSLRLKEATHKDFKQTCEANKTSISKILKTLVVLFLNDYGLQQRVLKEANRN